MKITKFGHCCLLIEIGELRLLTDPGNYTGIPDISTIDAILITHEHQDHLHLESLKALVHDNSGVEIISHSGVGKILKKEGLPYRQIADGEEISIKNIPIESCGTEHACIHADLPKVHNTGFYINKTFFYPGDSFHNPKKAIQVLALPVSAPWMRLEEAIEYAKAINPRFVFPVHDGMLRQDHRLEPTRRIPRMILEPLGIKYVDMKEGSVEIFNSPEKNAVE